jgi:hypothetical protein
LSHAGEKWLEVAHAAKHSDDGQQTENMKQDPGPSTPGFANGAAWQGEIVHSKVFEKHEVNPARALNGNCGVCSCCTAYAALRECGCPCGNVNGS